jgi:hypothetical protein
LPRIRSRRLPKPTFSGGFFFWFAGAAGLAVASSVVSGVLLSLAAPEAKSRKFCSSSSRATRVALKRNLPWAFASSDMAKLPHPAGADPEEGVRTSRSN